MRRARTKLLPIMTVAVLAAILSPLAARGLEVVSSTPTPYDLAVSGSLSQISVTFDTAPQVPPAEAFRVFGAMSGLKTGTVTAAGNTLTFTHVSDWEPGETVNVNLRADVQTATGDPLGRGHYFSFTIESGVAPLDWSAPFAYGASDVPYFIYGGDLDGDGTPDVAAPNEGTNDVSVFRNPNLDGKFDSFSDYSVGGVPSCIFGEDFDNDGDVDLATADHAGTMSVMLNNGDGTFAPSTLMAAGTNCRQVHGGDFDGDNDIDLCATAWVSDEVYLYENDGTGTYAAGVPYTDIPDGPFAITTGDWNGNGLLDIAVVCQNVDSLAVMMNDGTGSFTTTGTYKVGDGPWDLVANDMDADGDCDLVTVCAFNNRVQVVFNDGSGAFPTKLGQVSSSFPLGVHATDLDGDGDLDVIASNFNSGNVKVFLNDGAGTIQFDETLNVDRSGSYSWGHDLDGDGDLDLSVVDELSDSLYVFFNGDPPSVGSPNVTPSAIAGPRLSAWPNPALVSQGFDVVLQGLSGHVIVDLVDVGGRRVRRLHDGPLPENGIVPWPGSTGLAAGAYVLSAGDGRRRVSATVRLLR